MVLIQKTVLCDIFEEEGSFKAAEEVLNETLSERRVKSRVVANLPAILSRLAKVSRAQDKRDFAEECIKGLLKAMEARYGAEHIGTLETLTILAEILLEKGE